MAFIPVPNVAEVILQGELLGQLCINTFYFQSDTPPITVEALNTLSAALAGQVNAILGPVLPDGWIGDRVVATDLTTNPGLQAETLLTSVQGDNPSTLPNNVVLAIKRQGALTGRSNRGRIYWPLYDDALIGPSDPNAVTSLAAAEIVNAITEWLLFGEDEGWTSCIVSRYTNGAPRVTGVAVPIVGWSVADLNTDSMRRRLVGRGA